jgi:hypothetical protein
VLWFTLPHRAKTGVRTGPGVRTGAIWVIEQRPVSNS